MPVTLASIPSPEQGVWHLGIFPVRGYALAILAGIVVGIWFGGKRWVARGGRPGTVGDLAIWMVPFGIAGGRIYHVLTDWQTYFGDGGDPLRALEIWKGGLGIWGAIAFGGLGAWIGCRRKGIALPPMADALAPGIVLAQGIGRWGNWFNQELFGKPTTLPWGLQIDPMNRPAGYEQYATFHPTFLYESLWCIGVALVLLWADRRFTLGHGRVFALYVALYTLGRGWIEALRIDDAHHILGLRLNDWTALLVFLAAVVGFAVSARRHPGRESEVEPGYDGPPPPAGQDDGAGDEAPTETADDTSTEDDNDDATERSEPAGQPEPRPRL